MQVLNVHNSNFIGLHTPSSPRKFLKATLSVNLRPKTRSQNNAPDDIDDA